LGRKPRICENLPADWAQTGGIWPTRFISARQDAPQGTAWLFLRGKAMVARADELLAILRDLLLTVNWITRNGSNNWY